MNGVCYKARPNLDQDSFEALSRDRKIIMLFLQKQNYLILKVLFDICAHAITLREERRKNGEGRREQHLCWLL